MTIDLAKARALLVPLDHGVVSDVFRREQREQLALKLARALAEEREAGAAAEREACCAILASAEPNTRAEQAIEKIDARIDDDDVPDWLAGLIGEWLEATADQLADYQQQIRARATDPVHWCDQAQQPDVHVECSDTWSTPAWGTIGDHSKGVYRLDSGELYTFDGWRVTCPKCLAIRPQQTLEQEYEAMSAAWGEDLVGLTKARAELTRLRDLVGETP